MVKLKQILMATAVSTIGMLGSVNATNAELIIFDWGGYEDENFFQDYMEKYGSAPSYNFFSDEEEAFQKIRAGYKADLHHPCSPSVVKLRDAGMLLPIDTSRLTNWDKVIPEMKNLDGFNTDGNQWAVPIDWGATAMTYRTDLVSEDDASTLQSFADPKFAGKVSIPDNVDDAYALGFLATGVTDWNKASDADFKKASDFLRAVHKNIRTYWSDGSEIRSLMQSGEVEISWSWNEVAAILQSEDVPVSMKEDTAEGKSTWMCAYVHIKDNAGNTDEAYDFLNAWLTEESGAYIVNEWGYGHSLAPVMEKYGADAGFGTLDSYSENTLWQAPASPDLRERMVSEFELIKAGF
jgi:spermidine/putrescine transport system substrate-binding protein